MDPPTAVALGVVALAVAVAVWRHRRGGLHLDVKLWWDSDPADRDSPPDGGDGNA